MAKWECAACHRELEEGDNVFQVEEAIIGSQSIVVLSSPDLFCSFDCLTQFDNGRELFKGKKRIP